MNDGTGNTHKRSIEGNAHTGERRHESVANAVEHAEPGGCVAVADEFGER